MWPLPGKTLPECWIFSSATGFPYVWPWSRHGLPKVAGNISKVWEQTNLRCGAGTSTAGAMSTMKSMVKKQEFGASRSRLNIKRDLVLGKRRLEDLMEAEFYPIFTPPWNRCSLGTLQLLGELGYVAVSRFRGSRPQAPRGLPDFYANVDLHTRKEQDPAVGWKNLLEELQQAISSKFCGIMIHHQRMNEAAFGFLEMLIRILVKRRELQLVNYKDLNCSNTIR